MCLHTPVVVRRTYRAELQLVRFRRCCGRWGDWRSRCRSWICRAIKLLSRSRSYLRCLSRRRRGRVCSRGWLLDGRCSARLHACPPRVERHDEEDAGVTSCKQAVAQDEMADLLEGQGQHAPSHGGWYGTAVQGFVQMVCCV